MTATGLKGTRRSPAEMRTGEAQNRTYNRGTFFLDSQTPMRMDRCCIWSPNYRAQRRAGRLGSGQLLGITGLTKRPQIPQFRLVLARARIRHFVVPLVSPRWIRADVGVSCALYAITRRKARSADHTGPAPATSYSQRILHRHPSLANAEPTSQSVVLALG